MFELPRRPTPASRRRSLGLLALVLGLLALPASAHASSYAPKPVPGETRPAILVGNNWEGTTDIVDPNTFRRLDRVNVIPDREERMREIMLDPVGFGFFLGIRHAVGEGHDQFNDDVFSSHDGRTLFVSRPSFADVVAIDLATKKIVWRRPVSGYRSDHMAISNDGTKLLVSASTGNVVHEIDTATGEITGEFPSGDSPHENNYSRDGRLVYHASIGRVYTPTDRAPYRDRTKGSEFFQVVDAETMKVLKRIEMDKKLAEAGHPDMSGAVRPMALSPDERFVYFQVSFHHGFVEYDLVEDRVTRVAELPLSDEAAKMEREEYLLDSAHHGLAMNPEGTKLCAAGTMSDYAAIVDRETFVPRILPSGKKPYWSTNSADGRHCYVSASGDDWVTVISYETEKVLTRFPVGWHPQRVRNGVVRIDQYPMGAPGERFRLKTFHERSPIAVKRGDENVGCRADGAQELRLARCLVRVEARLRGERRPTLLAVGERVADGRRSFKVDVDFTREGRALLRRRPEGFRADMRVEATDSVGRTRRTAKRVTFQRVR